MRARILATLLLAVASGVAFAQSKELGPVKGDAKMGTTAAGGSAVKEFDPGKESLLGDLVFRAALTPGGTDALPLAVNINGQSLTPLCAYRAKDATADSWPAWGGYGETLSKVEAGGNTSDQAMPHLGSNEKARQFAGGDYYESATTANCQIGTEDIVVEAIYRSDVLGNAVFAGTRNDGASTGWHIYDGSANSFQLCHGATCFTLSPTASGADISHMLWAVDRNYSSAAYGARGLANGASAASSDASARSASIDGGVKFAIGNYPSGGAASYGALVSLVIWRKTDLFPGDATNATIMDAFAADRFARFTGTREQVNGIAPTSLDTGPRCAWTGGASGKLDCYSSSWAITGADMPPGQGSLGGVALGGGLLVHAQIAQPLLQSRTLNTTWTAVGAATVATSTATPFVDARQTYKVVDDQAGSEEYIYQDIDITARATGDALNLCPWAATESGTQVYTVSVTEQTACAGSTTHYKPTATTSWQLQGQTHTILDGACTSARITLRPYDVASGAAATGSVTAMVNAFSGLAGTNGCLPVFVETTTAAITATNGSLRYPTTYSAALGGSQVTDASSYIPGRRIFAAQYAAPFADLTTSRETAGTVRVVGPSAAYLRTLATGRSLAGYDGGEKWACSQTSAHTGFVGAMLSVDFSRDLYTTFYNGRTCQSTTADTGLGATAFTYFYAGDYTAPTTVDITGMLIRNVEVYR